MTRGVGVRQDTELKYNAVPAPGFDTAVFTDVNTDRTKTVVSWVLSSNSVNELAQDSKTLKSKNRR